MGIFLQGSCSHSRQHLMPDRFSAYLSPQHSAGWVSSVGTSPPLLMALIFLLLQNPGLSPHSHLLLDFPLEKFKEIFLVESVTYVPLCLLVSTLCSNRGQLSPCHLHTMHIPMRLHSLSSSRVGAPGVLSSEHCSSSES